MDISVDISMDEEGPCQDFISGKKPLLTALCRILSQRELVKYIK